MMNVIIALIITMSLVVWFITTPKNFKPIQGAVIFYLIIVLPALTLKACDREYEYEQAKHAQWKYERENGLPYTSFRGE